MTIGKHAHSLLSQIPQIAGLELSSALLTCFSVLFIQNYNTGACSLPHNPYVGIRFRASNNASMDMHN